MASSGSRSALVRLAAAAASAPVMLMATPAISEGVVYVRGMQHVYAIGTQAKP